MTRAVALANSQPVCLLAVLLAQRPLPLPRLPYPAGAFASWDLGSPLDTGAWRLSLCRLLSDWLTLFWRSVLAVVVGGPMQHGANEITLAWWCHLDQQRMWVLGMNQQTGPATCSGQAAVLAFLQKRPSWRTRQMRWPGSL
ncbi:hypothetical protein LY76DRAFT_197157 [Colletotrichum caudatum]|nr:hypothetical protein LY76DRAFT_197157 [Colletotrichum caudatum]